MDRLMHGVERFMKTVFPADRERYKKLAREGQSPKTLIISCSDSRVIPEVITQSEPGELFVCRNAGNLVPRFDGGSDGMAATIEYAVVGLGVRDIVVCGHTECGAMQAVLRPEKTADMPSVRRWLTPCRCAHVDLVHKLVRTDRGEAVRRLAMANVVVQLANLRGHPSVAAALAHGDLSLHGWLFDIERGDILVHDEAQGTFTKPADHSARTSAVAQVRSINRNVASALTGC